MSIMTNYFRSLLLFILVGLSFALPIFWYDVESEDDFQPQLMPSLRNLGPMLKRNIAIGRGDGLRPGK
ncbi:unnamed protein product [Nippostrongylus brasiliensis]|uniref:Conotoxin n=1 Tax=Nippostrongylus brasiliensis TaxID=27835 RepID=A0A0N4YS06_NIPBR|nr:unnamed protein product [Nippostrongylus brasiliensis]